MGHTLHNLILQILGKKNLFGYSKTAVNQLHLIFWFLGEYYSSKKFNRTITLYWTMQSIIYFATVISHNSTYLLFSPNHHLTDTLFAFASLLGVTYAIIIFTFGCHLHTDDVIKTFKILDEVNIPTISNHLIPTPRTRNNLSITYTLSIIQIGLPGLYGVILYRYIFTGYDKENLCNMEYFLYPLYCQGLRSWSVFVALQLSQAVIFLPAGSIFLLAPLFPLIAVGEFDREFRNLRDFLNHRSELFLLEYERSMMSSASTSQQTFELQQSFLKSIHSGAKYHRELLRAISHLRTYLEFNMSVSLVCLITIEILVIYIVVLVKEEPIFAILRFSVVVFIFAVMQYVYCLTAKLFEDMSQVFGDAVYDIPWYYMSASVRKSVHLLLYQSRVNVEFKVLRTYTLNMGFLLRSCKNIYSAVNVLRRQVIYND